MTRRLQPPSVRRQTRDQRDRAQAAQKEAERRAVLTAEVESVELGEPYESAEARDYRNGVTAMTRAKGTGRCMVVLAGRGRDRLAKTCPEPGVVTRDGVRFCKHHAKAFEVEGE